MANLSAAIDINHFYSNNVQNHKARYEFNEYPINETNITPLEVTNETVVYAIICPSNLTKALKPLADWKTKKGVPAKIYTIDGPLGIYSSYSKGDNATKIHDFLTDMHENNSNLEWVLLVGDEDIIPSRSIFVNASSLYGLDDYYYSDYYYAGLNNSWDQDNDGIYGEQKGDINWQVDLYAGRLPVNNYSEADLVIKKILMYETAPEVGTWMKNATFWSGLLDAPNNKSAYEPYKDNAIKVTNKILPHVPKHMNVVHLYDYNQSTGGNYTYISDTLDHQSGKNSFTGGHSILNFAGQAYYTGDELAHYFNLTGKAPAPDGFTSLFTYNDAKYSTNGNKLPLMYLSTCSVNFSELDDSNLEQLLTAPDGGAIGLIGNSGKSYRGEVENGSSYGNWWLNEHFWRLFFNGTYQQGKCLYEVKEKYVTEVIYPGVPYIQMAVANLVGYNLLGDPELSIWTDMPERLSINTSLIFQTTHQLKFKVADESGVPVENARVCVYNSETYESEITNDSGIAIIALDPRLTDTLEATVSAHNFLPANVQFSYENQPPVLKQLPDVVLDEDTVLENHVELKEYISDPDNLLEDLQIYISKNTDGRAGVRIDVYKRIDIRPFSNWNGKSIVTINITDGIAQTSGNFTVTVHSINDAPRIIYYIPDHELRVGSPFYYQVYTFDIENNTIKYSDDSKIINIDENSGVIDYKAMKKHVGKHKITITVSDGMNSTYQEFILEIYDVEDDGQEFLDLYWFPMSVIIITSVIILLILLFSGTKPKSDELKEDEIYKKKESKGITKLKKKDKGNN